MGVEHLGADGEVHRRVVAHGGVRARACLDPHHAIAVEHPGEGPPDVLGVLLRVDVVGDHGRGAPAGDEHGHEGLDEGGLAGAHGASDADAQNGIGHAGEPIAPSERLISSRDRPLVSGTHLSTNTSEASDATV